MSGEGENPSGRKIWFRTCACPDLLTLTLPVCTAEFGSRSKRILVELLGTEIPVATQELLVGIESFGIQIGQLLEGQSQGTESKPRRS